MPENTPVLKRATDNSRRTDVAYLGVFQDDRRRRHKAWQTTGLGRTFVRLEPFAGGRARTVYDPVTSWPVQ
jgi:hypothetical protein